LHPVPAEEDFVAREEASLFAQHGLVMTPEARQRLTHDQTPDYYFYEEWVSYQETPLGVGVLAVSLGEIRRLLKGLNQEESLASRTRQV